MNFQQTYLYWLAGAVLLVVAIMSWRDKSNPRRLTTGLFWGLYGLVFLLGDWTYQLVGDKRKVNIAVGGVVVVLALIAGFGGVRSAATISVARKRKPPARNASATNFSFRRWRFRSSPSLAYCCLTICPHGRWRSSGRATTRR
ncbi:FIG001614: Membrane protein [Klebsiella pneumoniae IS10]|nr:FIG001614: Membrane protein [Klebsiella pneumoniae IS10]